MHRNTGSGWKNGRKEQQKEKEFRVLMHPGKCFMHILTFSLLSLVLTVAVMELERLKNQHLILPYYCLLHSLLDFRLIVHLLFCALRKCTTGYSDMVQAKFLPEDMRKTLIIDEGTTKCNNP